MVGPEVRSGRRVHQLKIYSQSAVRALNATDDRVLRTEVSHKVCHVHPTIPIEVGCLFRNHPQFVKAAEIPDQVMGEDPRERGGGRTTSAWLRCRSVCGDHNFGATPSATIVPIARKAMIAHA